MLSVRSQRAFRSLNPTIIRYFVSIAVIGFAIDGGVYAVLLNLFLVRLGYGPERVGLVNAVGMLVYALACWPAGILGERFSNRRMLLVGLRMLLVGCMLLPLADLLPPAWQFSWLMLWIPIIYAGIAAYTVNTAPFVMDVVHASQRSHIFSLQSVLTTLAAFVGSLLGGFLPPLIGGVLGTSLDLPVAYRYALMTAGLAMIPALFALRAVPPVVQAQHTTVRASNESLVAGGAPIGGLLLMMALVRMLQVSGIGIVNTFFNVYLDQRLLLSTAQIGIIIGAAHLIGAPAALATAALTRRFGTRAVGIGATLGTALSILPIALVPYWGAAGVSFIGIAGLAGIRYTASLVYFLELVPPQRRATLTGIMEMAAGLSFALIAFGGGYIIALWSYTTLFLIGAGLTAFSALLFWWYFRGRAPVPSGDAG